MAVTFHAVGSITISSTLSVPTVSNDDTMIAMQYIEPKGNSTQASWTKNRNVAASSDFRIEAWVRKAASEPASYTWSGGVAGVILTLTGGDPSTLIAASSSSTDGANDNVAPSITTTVDGAMLVCIAANISGFPMTFPGGGWTERGDSFGLAIATLPQATAGATGTVTVTGAEAVILLAVQPAGSGFNSTQTVDDTGGGADALTPATLTSTLAETGAGSDAITGASTASLTDAGSGTDTAVGAAAAALADTAAGTDTPASEYQFAVADTSTGADAVSAQSGVSLADTATGAELVASALAAAIAETGLGADTVSAGGQDTADSPDSATGVDTSAAGYAATVADAGVAIETATVFLALTVADVATGVDTASQPGGLALVTAHATTVPAARRTVILARAARQAVLRAAVRRVTVQELD